MERGCGCGPSHAWLWKDPSPSSRKLKGGPPAPRLWAHKRRPRCLPFPHAATHTRPYYLFARGPTGVGHPTSSPFFSLSFIHAVPYACSLPHLFVSWREGQRDGEREQMDGCRDRELQALETNEASDVAVAQETTVGSAPDGRAEAPCLSVEAASTAAAQKPRDTAGCSAARPTPSQPCIGKHRSQCQCQQLPWFTSSSLLTCCP
jgi:hypothetical protein